MKKTTLYIQGMHCPSCEILMHDKLKEIQAVKQVKADFRKQQAEISYKGSFGKKELEKFNQSIKPYGYELVDKQAIEAESEPLSKRLIDITAIAVVLFISFFFAQEFNLIPKFNISSGLTLSTVFILGLVASTSTCMATSGALYLATIGKLNKLTNYELRITNLLPAVFFNLGRIISYGFFGLVAGLIGKTIAYNLQLNSILTLLVSLGMILIGLDMLKLIPFSSLSLGKFTGGLFERVENRLLKNPQKTAFLLGAITYLLPCGFTQIVQLYALRLADPIKSAVVMTVFALGTVPVLMAVGLLSSVTNNRYFLFFQKVIAVLIVMVGVYYFSNFLSLVGVNVNRLTQFSTPSVSNSNVIVENGYQILKMTVNSSGYSPNLFTIKKGIPVKWIIEGKDVYGCQGYFVVPALGIQKNLQPGENKFEFTAEKEGTINFSCGMGMYKGEIQVKS